MEFLDRGLIILSSLSFSDIVTNLNRNLARDGCPTNLFVLFSKLEKISTSISTSNQDLAIALLAPFPHILNGIIDYREGPSQYGHVILNAALTCEGSFKSLYPIVFGKSFPKRYSVENIAREFEGQTTYQDIRIRKILPTTWVSLYSIRNRKTSAHYGPISEHTDALYTLLGSIYVVINHIEFIKNDLADSSLKDQLINFNLETILLETINQIMLYPVIPTTVIQFTSDGPVISTKHSLTQQQAIGLILYALPFTQFEYSYNLLDKLLKLSGFRVKSLSGQLSNMDRSGLVTRILDKITLTTKGILLIQDIIDKIK